MVNKQQDPTDIWAWVQAETDEYRKKGGRWEVMVNNFTDFMDVFFEDTRTPEMLITRALEEARELRDTRWELLIRHWRLQYWLRQDQARRALPEAVDLMTLATDPQVRDVPQRICAYHDVVECFLTMDPVGYYQEIAENSQAILSQLPQRHGCATCARSNWMLASAASGKTEETEHLLVQTQALLNERKRCSTLRTYARSCRLLGKLDEAEQYCKEAVELAREQKNGLEFLKSLLSLASVVLAKNEIARAERLIHQARQWSKSNGGPTETVLLLELEGRLAFAKQRIALGADYLLQAAQMYLDMGCYRDTAEATLDVVEQVRKAVEAEEEAEQPAQIAAEIVARALDIAAQAISQLPPASQDLVTRLAQQGREPAAATQQGSSEESASLEELDARELAQLQELLQQHIAHGHLAQTVVTMYQVGRWYGQRDQHRAALDYLISSAAVERLVKVDTDEREDTLATLRRLQQRLPSGTVESALTSLETSIPEWLAPLLQGVTADQWSWIVRALRAEVAGQPVVEPEPEEKDATRNFNSWVEYAASLTALVVRFYQQVDQAELQSWWSSLGDNLEHVEDDMRRLREEDEAGHKDGIQQGLIIASLMRALSELSHGTPVADVLPQTLPPFNQIIEQIGDIASQPVWFHPGSSPIDYLVEQAAQRAVEALRKHDEFRARRLENLILRYKLMNLDIQPEKELEGIARFLDALQQLLLLDGQELPVLDPPLVAPFDAVLNAVYQSGQAVQEQEA